MAVISESSLKLNMTVKTQTTYSQWKNQKNSLMDSYQLSSRPDPKLCIVLHSDMIVTVGDFHNDVHGDSLGN